MQFQSVAQLEGAKENLPEGAVGAEVPTYNAHQVEGESEIVTTLWGDAVATEGNYVFEHTSGNFIVAQADAENPNLWKKL